jgi:FMN phosphatase YigB (HAD superfamily)
MLTPDDARDTVFLLDVDNTLLDNDRFSADLDARLDRDFGPGQRMRYRDIYTALRDQLGYADYLGALQAFRAGLDEDADLLQVSAFLLDYPFVERLYPQALDTIAHLHALGTPVVLSDGDIVFQPRKIQCSGLWDAVQGKVLVYLHKERMLDAVQRRFPARLVDDKPHLLAAMKRAMCDQLTTVFVQQGHYARDAIGDAISPAPDVTIARIDELLQLTPGQWRNPQARHLEQEPMP